MTVLIEKINVGERLRQDNGDIEGLAQSISVNGLLHPIVIDANYNLVAGGRRLLAVKSLNCTHIDVKMLGELTPQELRILELEENIRRKDLTEIEKSRDLNEIIESKKEINKYELYQSNENNKSTDSVEKLPGRPKGSFKNDSIEFISREIGIPAQTIRDAQQHVAAVDEFPVLELFPKHEAIQTAKTLREMPPEEKETAIEKLTTAPGEQFRDIAKRYMDEYKESPEKRQSDIQGRLRKILISFLKITEDDELYDAWFSDMSEDDLDEEEDTLNLVIRKVERLRSNFLKIRKERKTMRVVK